MAQLNVCPKCNTENGQGAKFCQECGYSISEALKGSYCGGCGYENSNDANFCFKCGTKLNTAGVPTTQGHKNKNPRKQSKNTKPVNKPALNPATLAFAAFVIIVIYLLIPDNETRQSPQSFQPAAFAEQKSNNPEIEANVLSIASKFICSCGTCGELPLATCPCETAQVERQFIRNALQSKQEPVSIINAVNSKYGWIKPEFAKQYGAGKFTFNSAQNLLLTPGLNIKEQKNELVLASFKDRMAIISSFSCTCGQCQIDELKDCSCNHPGGATEVKMFIDQKIQEGKYTKENIIQIVEGQYGKRLR